MKHPWERIMSICDTLSWIYSQIVDPRYSNGSPWAICGAQDMYENGPKKITLKSFHFYYGHKLFNDALITG